MTVDEFWQQVDRSGGPDACWPWQGKRNEEGWGESGALRGTLRAHRNAYILTCGPVPRGQTVIPKCGNRVCCNPAHMRLGTIHESLERTPNPRTKLTAEQVREIRDRFAAKQANQPELAREFGVSQTLVSFIVRGKQRADL